MLFSTVQQAKAYADLHQFDDAEAAIDYVFRGLDRFPILASHAHEVDGQVRTMRGDSAAPDHLLAALEAAEESGLSARAELLKRYVAIMD